MSYLVLARKWRPKYFDDVVGQQHVARTLKNSIEQDRVAHAYLFCGSRGVGKTSTARILAKALNCENGPQARPCYNCTACREIHEGQSVDVFEIDGASNRGINEIRELREGVRYAPSGNRYKIYIIDEVHMLTTEAFNALLKTLEEPPDHAHFIFATTEPQKIPVTILSRCQRFDFKRISQSDIVDHLRMLCDQEDIEAEKAALQLIARQANGGMRDAMSLLDQVISFAGDSIDEAQVAQILGVANRKHLFELSDSVLKQDSEGALMTLDEVNRYGYDLQQFASELVSHFRDLVVTRVVQDPSRVTNLTESELESAKDQVRDIEPNLLHRYFSVMAEGAQEMTRSPYPKLIFEMTLVRMAGLEPLVGLDLLVDRLGSLESTLEDDIDLEALEGKRKKKARRVEPAPEPESAPEGEPVPDEPEPAGQQEPEPRPVAETESETPDQPPAEGTQATVEQSTPPTEDTEDALDAAEADPVTPGRPTDGRETGGEPRDSDPVTPGRPTDGRETGGEPRDSEDAVPDRPMPPPDVFESASNRSTQGSPLSEPEQTTEDEDDEGAVKVAPDIDPLTEKELAELDDLERWRHIVRYLHRYDAPAAATCEHAYVTSVRDGTALVEFEPKYMEHAREGGRFERMERAVRSVLGGRWSLVIQPRDEDTDDGKMTIAEERVEELRQRKEALEERVLNHPVIKEAEELFKPDRVRSHVQLHDEH
jgi:DNA polymerase-3 subunit gamma/tau